MGVEPVLFYQYGYFLFCSTASVLQMSYCANLVLSSHLDWLSIYTAVESRMYNAYLLMEYRMKSLFFAIVSAMTLLFPGVYVQSADAEPVPMAYISIPFGSTSKVMADYGLQLARIDPGSSGVRSISSSTPYLDLKFSGTQLDSFSVNGINTISKVTSLNADGTSSTHSSINWNYVGWGLLAFGGLWWVCEERDWDLCGGDRDSDDDNGGMTVVEPPEL